VTSYEDKVRLYTPDAYEVQLESRPAVDASPPLSVRNAQAGLQGAEVRFLDHSKLGIDYDEVTQLLVTQIAEELAKQGVEIVQDAPNNLALMTLDVNLIIGGASYRCYVDVKAETSGGYVHGYTGVANSSIRDKACNAAIAKTAALVVSDPVMQRQLSGR
jgi:hypothetical protein